jgi:outer membrane protein TolC
MPEGDTMNVDRLRGTLSGRMTSLPPTRRPSFVAIPESNLLLLLITLTTALSLTPSAQAQVSFSSAVALALSTSPRVHMAQDDIKKATAALAETHDAYVPVVEGVMDLAYTYGAPLGEPTLFSFSAQSLAFSYSQRDYMRAAHSGLNAANLSLQEVREEVAEDAAVTYLSLDSAQQRRAALAQQFGYATRLSVIIQQRLDAGQDTPLELLQARHTAAQIRLQVLQLDDEIEGLRTHLTRLDGLPDGPLATESASIPALPEIPRLDPGIEPSQPVASASPLPDTPAVAAAFAAARAKQEQAFGDDRYLYRPRIGFFAQYSRFSTFNNYQTYYPAFSSNTLNAIAIGIQISVPFYDRGHIDKARESAADAQHAEHEAIFARDQMFEGRVKLRHAGAELSARADLADLDQQIAQQQLDATLIQLQSGNGNPNSSQLTPKDEQNARIQERQRYLELLDAKSKLRETQIQLLRLTGQLDAWLKSAIAIPSRSTP